MLSCQKGSSASEKKCCSTSAPRIHSSVVRVAFSVRLPKAAPACGIMQIGGGTHGLKTERLVAELEGKRDGEKVKWPTSIPPPHRTRIALAVYMPGGSVVDTAPAVVQISPAATARALAKARRSEAARTANTPAAAAAPAARRRRAAKAVLARRGGPGWCLPVSSVSVSDDPCLCSCSSMVERMRKVLGLDVTFFFFTSSVQCRNWSEWRNVRPNVTSSGAQPRKGLTRW